MRQFYMNSNPNNGYPAYPYPQQQQSPVYPYNPYQQPNPSNINWNVRLAAPSYVPPAVNYAPNVYANPYAANAQTSYLQQRIIQARQQNILYKQKLGQLMLQKKQTPTDFDNPYNIVPSPAKGNFQSKKQDDVALSSSSILPPEQSISKQPSLPDFKPSLSPERTQSSQGPPSRLLPPDNSPPVSVNYQKEIHNLLDQLNSKTSDHKRIIEGLKNEQISLAKRQEIEKKKENAQARQQIESILQKQKKDENGNGEKDEGDEDRFPLSRQPLWRHRAAGNKFPAPEMVMNSGRLFRVVVRSIIGMIIRPQHEIYRRRSQQLEGNKRSFERTLQVMLESIADWMGRTVQLPVSSIVTDLSLDFDPKDSYVAGSANNLKSRMLQLKVRLKTIVINLSKATMPPHLLSLLLTLCEDNVYYPDAFLWDIERKRMEFDRLGGTKHILSTHEQNKLGAIQLKEGFFVDMSVAKQLVMNILLVRVLLLRVVLSPWHWGVSKKPANRATKKVIRNLRILGTVLYRLIRDVNPLLPFLTKPAASHGQGRKNSNSNARESAKVSASLASSKEFAESSKDPAVLIADGQQGPAGQGQKEGGQLLKGLLSLAGISTDETPGVEEFQEGSVEYLLLEPRESAFDPIDLLPRVLPQDKELESVQHTLEEWRKEFSPILSDWADGLLRQMALERFKQKLATSTALPAEEKAEGP